MTDALKTRTLARLYLEQGHPLRARRILRDLLADAPQDADLLAMLAEANELARQGGDGSSSLKSAQEPSDFKSDDELEKRETIPSEHVKPVSQAVDTRERIRETARDLGAAVVDHLASRNVPVLTGLLDRIRKRRR